ncbi:hypothetical protein CR513_26852, partial [Mucuna pruriens]
MKKEIDVLGRNDTWTLATLSPRTKAIGCNNVERYKARLVVPKDNQKEGIDYNETFALVVKMVTVWTLLDVEASRSWILH